MISLTHAPHAHAPMAVGQIMATVMLALVPATLYGFWLYGWPALFLWSVAMATALLTEAASLFLQGRAAKPALLDGSAALTAWLLAVSLPPFAPWWVAAIVIAGFAAAAWFGIGRRNRASFEPAALFFAAAPIVCAALLWLG